MYAMAMKSWAKGEPMQRVELPTPEPGAHEVRVAVHAIGVNPVDWKMRSQGPLRKAARLTRVVRGPRGPVIVGVDFSGVVEAVGAKVADIVIGQRVYGGTNFSRGQHGSYADTVIVRPDQLCPVPDAVSLEEAGALPVAGVTAWKAVHEYRRISAGSRVLVIGASGGVGQFIVQIAKRSCGATVVGVCSAKNADLVRSLGADSVLDYAAGAPLAQAKAHGPFDLVIDCVGGYPASLCRALLVPGGRHVMVAGQGLSSMVQILVPPFRSRLILGTPTRATLQALINAVTAKQVTVPIAERMPLTDVEAAHAMSQSGRMTGKLVLLPR